MEIARLGGGKGTSNIFGSVGSEMVTVVRIDELIFFWGGEQRREARSIVGSTREESTAAQRCSRRTEDGPNQQAEKEMPVLTGEGVGPRALERDLKRQPVIEKAFFRGMWGMFCPCQELQSQSP